MGAAISMVAPFFLLLIFLLKANPRKTRLTVSLAWIAIAKEGGDAGNFVNHKLSIFVTAVSCQFDWSSNMIRNIETVKISEAYFNAN